MELRKRLYAAVILLTVVIAGLLLLVWLGGQPLTGKNTQPPPHLPQSAADAAAVLQAWLTDNWAADGVFVACTLTLSRHDPAENDWTFQVYSEQKNRLLVAMVQEREVKVLRDIVPLYRQLVLPEAAWKQDSPDILAAWWRAGGATAWNSPQASMMALRLGMREDGIPSWQLTLTPDDVSLLEYWEIRADTGALLEHSSTGGQR